MNANFIIRQTEATGAKPMRHNAINHNKKQLPLQVLKKFRIIYGTVRQHFREIERTCGVTGSQLWVMQEVANISTGKIQSPGFVK